MTKAQILEQFDELVGVPKGYFGSIEQAMAKQECNHLYEQVGVIHGRVKAQSPSDPDREVQVWECVYCGNQFRQVV